MSEHKPDEITVRFRPTANQPIQVAGADPDNTVSVLIPERIPCSISWQDEHGKDWTITGEGELAEDCSAIDLYTATGSHYRIKLGPDAQAKAQAMRERKP